LNDKVAEGGGKEIQMVESEAATDNSPSISKLHEIKKGVRGSEIFAGKAKHNSIHSLNQTTSRRRWSGSSGRCRWRRVLCGVERFRILDVPRRVFRSDICSKSHDEGIAPFDTDASRKNLN
jgi:hypothetical protein